MSQEYDFLMKLILVGDSGVGKTNILSKYLKNDFDPDSKATVGVEFGTKNIEIDNKRIKVQIWDTAGQERYKSITSTYYKGAKGAFIVYDITRKSTFDNIDKWIGDLKNNGDENMIVYLVGNKSDLNDMREVRKDEAMTKSEKFNIAFSETSALYGDNIHKIFQDLMEKVYINFYRNVNINREKEINKGVDLNEESNEKNNNQNNPESERKCC
jgi:small GTP-binding protein